MPPRRRGDVKPAGQIRQSQVVTTFGPGAMMDLPDYAVIIGGLDHWSGYAERPITEERLAAKVNALLHRDSVRFYAPPPDPDDPSAPINGVTAWLFPEWFVAQSSETREGGVRARPLVYRTDLDKGMTYRRDREKPVKVVPIRFVQACARGHVSDINWKLFVHGKDDPCSRSLWIEERGTSGDLTDVFIRCDCGKSKALSAATKLNDLPLGHCNGRRPWLGPNAAERCGGSAGPVQPNRLLIRAASNAYFAQTLSVISIPETGARVRAAVDEVWEDFLQYSESLDDVVRDRRRQKVSAALERLSNEEVWEEVQRRKGGPAPTSVGIREAEIKTLLSSPDSVGTDQPDGLFYARTITIPDGASTLTGKLSRVVKVHRLREVIAQIGFTRFEAAVPDVNGELALDVERADLAFDQDWLPADREQGRGAVREFEARRRQGVVGASGRYAAFDSVVGGLQCLEKGEPGFLRDVPGRSVHHAPLAVASAHHGRRARLRLCGQLDPRTDLCERGRLRHPALHGDPRCRGHSWRARRSGGSD